MTADDERAIAELGAHMDRKQRETLLAGFLARDVAAGDAIVAEGESQDSLFVVVRGTVVLSVRDGRGHVLELASLGPGRAFGEPSLLESAPASATATAKTDARVLQLSRAAFDELRGKEPKIASLFLRAIVEELAERVRTANTAIERDGGSLRLATEKQGFLARTFSRFFGARAA